MQLIWSEKVLTNTSEFNVDCPRQYSAECKNGEHKAIQSAINESIEKAASLLPHNINTESRYVMFEWDSSCALLTIVVTNDDKKKDAPHTVQCHFSSLQDKQPCAGSAEEKQALISTDDIRYWIRDYLTTCASFMQYSLVAAFHSGKRSDGVIL